MRCVLESLALAYRRGLERTETWPAVAILGSTLSVAAPAMNAPAVHRRRDRAPGLERSGGSNRDRQSAVSAPGPGRIASIAEGRALIRASLPIRTFEPQASEGWDEAFDRFQALGAMRRDA